MPAPTRRARPALEPLETRALQTRVVLADIDTGAIAFANWAVTGFPGMPDRPLGDYLEPGWDFRNPGAPGWDFRNPGAPTPAVDVDAAGYGGHGSMMAAQYALAMEQAGLEPEVVPLITGDDRGSSPFAIDRALDWVAAQATADPTTQWVVAMPIDPTWFTAADYRRIGRLGGAGVPVSLGAGNVPFDVDPLPLGRAHRLAPNLLVTAAADPAGDLQWYSAYGRHGVAVAAALDYAPMGTSGASEIGAAWLATEAAAHPHSPGQDGSAYAATLVQAVARAGIRTPGTVGKTAHGWLPGIPYTVPLPPVSHVGDRGPSHRHHRAS
jgi:hypothetical protein